jgi:hypothetical protein
MGRFHNYSFGNILEIARQKPDATRVAGMYARNQLGRKVIKGQKGIRILAPMIGVLRKKDKEAEKDITKQNQPVLVGFRSAYVFDRLSRDLRPARVRPASRTTPVYCAMAIAIIAQFSDSRQDARELCHIGYVLAGGSVAPSQRLSSLRSIRPMKISQH